MLKVTFLFSRSRSAMAQSSFSPPVHLPGLASALLIAIADFLIWKSNSHPSGLTIKPLLSVDTTFTVIIWFLDLSLNQSNGSGWVCFKPTLIFCSATLISNTFTFILSPFLYLFNSSSPFVP